MGIFRTWDDLINEFTNVAMEVTGKRSEKFIPLEVVPAHGKLVGRARYLREWRKLHEQLQLKTRTRPRGRLGTARKANVMFRAQCAFR